MLDEQRGTALLKERFQKAGYQIQENYAYPVAGVTVHLDGYDPERSVGYEFLTTAAGDREEMTPAVIEALEAGAEDGTAWVLLVDEVEAPEEDDLKLAADRFLELVAARR